MRDGRTKPLVTAGLLIGVLAPDDMTLAIVDRGLVPPGRVPTRTADTEYNQRHHEADSTHDDEDQARSVNVEAVLIWTNGRRELEDRAHCDHNETCCYSWHCLYSFSLSFLVTTDTTDLCRH